ncbi:MAG TPA: YetF domain-containing protein [Pirellulales bacterium]|jgi:uncharacterized membrane protein YcaP (DUF421 family)|nr:YetF domain-containing protein [Pirellulales bacterium]
MLDTILHNVFVLDVPLLEKIIRPILVYCFLIVGLRLAGKREMAQLNAFDLVVLLTISNTVQNAIIGNDNSLSGGVIGASALLLTNALVVRFLYTHDKLDRLIEGEPDVLIKDGKVRMDRLRSELMTLAELQSAAHKQGFASLGDVERAVLEPSGVVSFIAKRPLPEEARQAELLARLDQIDQRLAALAEDRA